MPTPGPSRVREGGRRGLFQTLPRAGGRKSGVALDPPGCGRGKSGVALEFVPVLADGDWCSGRE
ncbi:hypothetical protein GGQ88_001297 [Novosphingobium hassiacum]|uniref:Uncharacterized protein n=1 Tax=Novosphingobium hassiacum TaxID=173676 RepID=A0A7W5ZV54_9SPHN|nr:hypothetical protein [Novosphingobium hassiacum]